MAVFVLPYVTTTIWALILLVVCGNGVASFLLKQPTRNRRGRSVEFKDLSSFSPTPISHVGVSKNRFDLFRQKISVSDSYNSRGRLHRIQFVSPLLDYGYPPAVNDLAAKQKTKFPSSETRDDENYNEKPILLYLPGFDGTYLCPFIQFPELGTEFEVWCMTIGMDDRSKYEEIKKVVLDFLKNELAVDGPEAASDKADRQEDDVASSTDAATTPAEGTGILAGFFGGNSKKNARSNVKRGRPIYLAGESFGGILASDVALTLLTEQMEQRNNDGDQSTDVESSVVDLQGLVLINPATCYERSQLATVGPQIAKTPLPFYLLGLFSKLVPLFTDNFSLAQLFLILQAKALPSIIDDACREAYMGRVALSLPMKLEFMPPSTLSWRLNEWLQTGCDAVRDSSFAAFPHFRSLIVVGEQDKTLPSIAEAERLANKVMNPSKTHIHVVDSAGHGSTCGSRLDLTAVMRYCFTELQKPAKQVKTRLSSKTTNESKNSMRDRQIKRTRMKLEAERGVGAYFGMEERYDKANIGLNPLLYWSEGNFRAVRIESKDRVIISSKTWTFPNYKRSWYSIID